jgi:hypothetical protein
MKYVVQVLRAGMNKEELTLSSNEFEVLKRIYNNFKIINEIFKNECPFLEDIAYKISDCCRHKDSKDRAKLFKKFTFNEIEEVYDFLTCIVMNEGRYPKCIEAIQYIEVSETNEFVKL